MVDTVASKQPEPMVDPQFNLRRFVDRFYWLFFALSMGLLIFLCFYNLGETYLVSSDEGQHGVNAYEMIKNGNYIANTYNGNLDYWNLKPPLSFYFIMLGYRIFGYNAWGLRFFSAVAYVLLVIIVAMFLKKKFNCFASLISIWLFSGCYIFFLCHFVRHGDPDSLFILFIGVGLIALYLSKDNHRWLYLTGLMIALAFLTKSYHALIMLPIIFFYLIFTNGFKRIKWYEYFTIPAVTLAPILIWAIARICFDGWQFIDQMLVYDVFQRSTTAIEGHKEHIFFFLPFILVYDQISVLCLVLLIWTVLRKIFTKQKLSAIEKLTLISVVCFYFLYSIVKTKLEWYIFPTIVPLVIFSAVKISMIWQNSHSLDYLKRAVCCIFLVLVACLVGYSTFLVITARTEDELQDFIAYELPIDNTASYYFQDTENDCEMERAELLVFEWRTNQYLQLGGVEAFAKTNESAYLIVEITDEIDRSSLASQWLIKISTNEKYAIYYHAARD